MSNEKPWWKDKLCPVNQGAMFAILEDDVKEIVEEATRRGKEEGKREACEELQHQCMSRVDYYELRMLGDTNTHRLKWMKEGLEEFLCYIDTQLDLLDNSSKE